MVIPSEVINNWNTLLKEQNYPKFVESYLHQHKYDFYRSRQCRWFSAMNDKPVLDETRICNHWSQHKSNLGDGMHHIWNCCFEQEFVFICAYAYWHSQPKLSFIFHIEDWNNPSLLEFNLHLLLILIIFHYILY